ncbi:lytic transglycosylase domain-containing protein [Pseudophaeobacter leonis]|uniref:lytic transglycosylase domain-containing protein n=1 Tax=Pseudophaeobacter leonis TaxID=1144477 RepID=UPI0009F3CD6F|nr:lytic transglycosylase domain-containing protein [Pseudophaeobacter leonis]
MHRRHLLQLFLALPAALLGLSACSTAAERPETHEQAFEPPLFPNETPALRKTINRWSDYYEVPRPLVHRLAVRESTHRPTAVNRPYYGILQILPATARSMGFTGAPHDLLDADTNLEYSVKYLRGAWLLSDGSYDTAVKHYSRGYWHEAKRRGMLKETGLVD